MSCSCQWYRVCDAGALRAEPLATLYILRGQKKHWGRDKKEDANTARTCVYFMALSLRTRPPGLGLSCPQPDADHPARWVRFLAPRPWM